MNYYQVFTITSDPFIPEILSGLLWELKISGLTEESDCIKIFSDESNTDIGSKINVLLQHLITEKLIKKYQITKNILEDKNWNEIWEKNREVIRVTDRIIIKPTFKNYTAEKNEIVITLDPKMSFGTGEHQTTRLMLNLLEKNVETGMKILDLGSGTGILSIAAVKFGASKAVAIDIDENCFENCNENCELNNVSGSVKILTGEINDVEENNFDIILANIQKNVLLEIAEQIKMKIRKNGKLILSGLLNEDQNSIEEKYHSLGFRTEKIETMEDWIAIVLISKS